MRYLRTLIWVVFAVLLAILASHNWADVTLNLWGNLQADIKLPLLILIVWAIGFIPTAIIARGRLWQAKRKLLLQHQLAAAGTPPSVASRRIDGASEGLA